MAEGTISQARAVRAPDPICPVTASSRRGPETLGGNHHNAEGTIGTSVPLGGTVTFEPGGPGCVADDGSLAMKWPWWGRQIGGRLAIEGRRLDGEALPLRARIPAGYSGDFQSSALIFAEPGCWEVTGKTGSDVLTFVVRVVKIGDGPEWRCGSSPRPPTIE